MNKQLIEIQCHVCRNRFPVTVDIGAMIKWKNGEGFIQDLMPDLSPSERELLISHTCDDCFNQMFNLGEYNE